MKKTQKNIVILLLTIIFLIIPVVLPSSNNINNKNAIATPQKSGDPELTVNLGSAINFVVLAKDGISTTGTTQIVGNIGASPCAATYITGFDLIMDSSNTFSTSSLVVGNVYASDYTEPTPSIMTTAISDMETAYVDAAGRTIPDGLNLGDGAGEIGGLTFTAGLWKWTTDVVISTDIYISGSATDIFIFQCAQKIDLANGIIVHLQGGAQAKNIFWQAAGQVTLGTTSNMKGIILGMTAIVITTGATLIGRAFAQAAVTLDANIVTMVDTVKPSVPILDNIIPDPDLDGDINLNWNDAVGATSYNVLRYTMPINSGNVLLASVIATGITTSDYQDLGRTDGTWWYAVQAVNSTGTSDVSNSVSVLVTLVADGEKPNAPVLYTIAPNPDFDGNIHLDWNNVLSANTYNVLRYTTEINTGNFLLASLVAEKVNVSEYNDVHRPNGTFYYVIQSQNASGVSIISNCKSVVVTKVYAGQFAPTAPILNPILPNHSTNGTIKLEWNDIANAITYIVLRYNQTITKDNLQLASVIAIVNVSEYKAYNQTNGKWYYAVQAENSTGISELSNIESVEINVPRSILPLWAWFAIVGGIIVLGVIIYFVSRAIQTNYERKGTHTINSFKKFKFE